MVTMSLFSQPRDRICVSMSLFSKPRDRIYATVFTTAWSYLCHCSHSRVIVSMSLYSQPRDRIYVTVFIAAWSYLCLCFHSRVITPVLLSSYLCHCLHRVFIHMSLFSQRCVHTSLPVSPVPVKMAITATAAAALPPLAATSRNSVWRVSDYALHTQMNNNT